MHAETTLYANPVSHILCVILIILAALSACQVQPANQSAGSSAEPTLEFPNLHFTDQPNPTSTVAAGSSPEKPITTPSANSPDPQPSETTAPNPNPDLRLTLMAVGDIMLGRTIADLIESEGHTAPFIHTAQMLRSADITVGNLECPISTRGEPEPKPYAFRAPPVAADALAFAGFSLVNLANNHILDYGSLALEDTLENLSARQIQTVGAGMHAAEAYAPAFIEVEGLQIAFLGFVDVHPTDYDYRKWEAGLDQPGVAWAHEDQVRAGVTAAKAQADIVIVLIHNGYEIIEQISSQQQKIAHLAIDSGASLVIGSHPHVLQRIERYQEGLIAYSMGNFVFDNFLFPPNYSAILSVELSPKGVESYALIDVVVGLNGVPQIMPYTIEE